jgi:tetratricopeptide (TPR) repeat protein
MQPAGNAIREATLESLGIRLPEPVYQEATEPYRRIWGTNTELQAASNPKIEAIIGEAQKALAKHDFDGALALLDSLPQEAPAGIPDHLAGVVASLRIQVLGGKFKPQEVDQMMVPMREQLLSQLAFSGLARLESSLVRLAIFENDIDLARRVIDQRGFIADLADDPRARASLLFWEAFVSTGGGRLAGAAARSRLGLLGARYYGTAELPLWCELAGVYAAPPPADHAKEAELAVREFLQLLHESEDQREVDSALESTFEILQRYGRLTPLNRLKLRGDRANWSLRRQLFDDAVARLRELQQEFRAAGDLSSALNALAGEGRALSRSGHYDAAVALFEGAIAEAVNATDRANLQRALGACQMLEATERRKPVDLSLVEKAVARFQDAISSGSVNGHDRALARLGLALALRHKGDQPAALRELDAAIAELAHINSPTTKSLMANRTALEDPHNWESIVLDE